MDDKAKNTDASAPDTPSVVVKKYANRRLYNTASSSYVTLDDLSNMVKEGVDFVVYDAKSGDDITRSVLTQIIFEQESRGQNLLPIQFLRRLIRFYGDSMQTMVPSYLEMSMEMFARQREDMQEHFKDAWGSSAAMKAYQEQARKNMELFAQTLRMFQPFRNADDEGDVTGEAVRAETSSTDVAAMRAELTAMKARLDALDPGETRARPSHVRSEPETE